MNRVVHEPSSALVARLIEEGALVPGDRLTEAFQRVDRCVFVPAFALHGETPRGARYRLLSGEDPDQREEWVRHVYADETLTIGIAGEPVTDALPGGAGGGSAPVVARQRPAGLERLRRHRHARGPARAVRFGGERPALAAAAPVGNGPLRLGAGVCTAAARNG